MRSWLLVLAAAACGSAPATSADAPGAADSGSGSVDAPPDASASCVASPPVFVPEVLLERPPGMSQTTTANIRQADLLGDGSLQIFVAEAEGGRVTWLRHCEPQCEEVYVDLDLRSPVRVQTPDLDQDGDPDLLVADIGILYPTDDRVGRVVWLRNDGLPTFTALTLLEDVGRVACAEAADLDDDGDLDVVVCAFGHSKGELLWLEQTVGGVFLPRQLDPIAGAIHAFPFDADGDGDLDIAAVLSQTTEEIRLYRNDGRGGFASEILFAASESYFGLSGIELADLDGDGDTDIVATNGDYLDGDFPEPAILPVTHGVAWLENDGAGQFQRHEIALRLGAYATAAADFDGDCDLDLALVAYVPPGSLPSPYDQSPALAWLENRGDGRFGLHEIDGAPEGIITATATDLDGDHRPDLLVGSMVPELRADGPSRLTLFRNHPR